MRMKMEKFCFLDISHQANPAEREFYKQATQYIREKNPAHKRVSPLEVFKNGVATKKNFDDTLKEPESIREKSLQETRKFLENSNILPKKIHKKKKPLDIFR